MTGIRHRFLAAMGLASALALGGCYDDGYGYGGVSVGSGYYGNGGYYDPYYGPGYYQPGLYTGWYDGFYYPGSGYYVYDRGGRRQRWSDSQRRYWEARRAERRADRGNDGRWANGRPGWNGDRNGWRGDRDGRWRGRDRDSDGRPGNWARPNPTTPPNGGVTTPGTNDPGRSGWRGGWRGNDGARPTPQPGLRDPQMGRPERNWGNRPSGGPRMGRPSSPGGNRGMAMPRAREN